MLAWRAGPRPRAPSSSCRVAPQYALVSMLTGDNALLPFSPLTVLPTGYNLLATRDLRRVVPAHHLLPSVAAAAFQRLPTTTTPHPTPH